jgi:hypothetical protein
MKVEEYLPQKMDREGLEAIAKGSLLTTSFSSFSDECQMSFY